MVMKVKAVQGVNDNRDTRHLSGDLAQEARLWVVGVNNGETFMMEDAIELPEGFQVLDGSKGITSYSHWDMTNTGSFDGRYFRTGRGDAYDFIASLLDAAQLVEEQIAQGHVNGGDVGHSDGVHPYLSPHR